MFIILICSNYRQNIEQNQMNACFVYKLQPTEISFKPAQRQFYLLWNYNIWNKILFKSESYKETTIQHMKAELRIYAYGDI